MQLSIKNEQTSVKSQMPHHSIEGLLLDHVTVVSLKPQQKFEALFRANIILASPAFQKLNNFDLAKRAHNTRLAMLTELACSIATGLSCQVGDPFTGDLEGGIEIRTSDLQDGGLVVRRTDKLHRPFIFCTPMSIQGNEFGLDYCIWGWMTGDHIIKNGKQMGDEKYPFWVMDRTQLWPIGGLMLQYHLQSLEQMGYKL